MTKADREKELNKLVCPKCNSPLVIYVDGLACSYMACGGVFSPLDVRSKMTLETLNKEFPKLRSMAPADSGSVNAKPAELSVLRHRSASSKQPKSIEGQMPLFG